MTSVILQDNEKMDHHDENQEVNESNDDLSVLAKIFLPIGFIVFGVFMTCILPRFCRWRRGRQRLDTNAANTDNSDENLNLSEEEIQRALVVKYVLPHSLAHTFEKEIQNKADYKWWNIVQKFRNQNNSVYLAKSSGSKSELLSSTLDNSTKSSSFSSSSSDKTEEALVCQICLEVFKIGDKVAIPKQKRMSCNHVFHQKCISAWLKRNNTCPCCRVPYIDMEEMMGQRNDEGRKRLLKNSFPWKKKCNSNHNHIASCQFCQIHGLIFHPSHCDDDDMQKLDDLEDEENKTISIRSTNDVCNV